LKFHHLLLSIALLCLSACRTQPDETEVEKPHSSGLSYETLAANDAFEQANLFYNKKDYEKALQFCNEILGKKAENVLGTYLLKGKILSETHRNQEAIAHYEDALLNIKNNPLLYYFLAENYFQIKDYKNAEYHVINSLELDLNSPNSHYLLAQIELAEKRIVPTLMAGYYFLMLEPQGFRANKMRDMLVAAHRLNLKSDTSKHIQLTLNQNAGTAMTQLELQTSLKAGQTPDLVHGIPLSMPQFRQITENYFKLVAGLRPANDQTIWWGFYGKFYAQLLATNNEQTYLQYITADEDPAADQWIKNNTAKIQAFNDWLRTKK